MKSFRTVKIFSDRYPFIGPTMWMLSVQYFIIQVIVADAWKYPFSLRNNTISDLGNNACGIYGGRIVCSPLHGLMNASFITLGLFMALGALLIYQEFRESRISLIGFSYLAMAGVGTLLVGLFPENTITELHLLGAGLAFLIGNVGLVILGLVLKVPRSLRIYTFISGLVSLIGLAFFASGYYLGLGPGLIERITAYPQTIWLIIFGLYMSKNHILKIPVKK